MSALRRRFFEYGVAILAIALAILFRWLLTPVVGSRIPFAILLGAEAVAVGVGGLYPALLVMVVGYVAGRFLFIEPNGSLALNSAADWITLAGYVFSCLTVTFFGLLMRRANRQVRASAAKLAELNVRKDQLLATVAHELRGPLAPIQNAVQLLRAQSTESGRDVQLAPNLIERQLDHLTRLIDDLVDMDSIARGQLELQISRLSLMSVVEAAIESSRSLLEAKQQQLVVTLPPQPLYVNADATRLEQIFVNLLTNASKYTPSNGWIEVAVQPENGTGLVRITDSGVGISAEAMHNIFEMFYQVDRSQHGLGIGLALVRQFVTLHGGTVAARSAGLGRGSVFLVWLPLAELEALLPTGATNSSAASSAEGRICLANVDPFSVTVLAGLKSPPR